VHLLLCSDLSDSVLCAQDDGTRFVAGLVATPLIQYYEATLDAKFLRTRLLPYLRELADFYTSYAQVNEHGQYELPYTCAQEICSGPAPYSNGTQPAEHNGHQDHAYARMVYSKLLAYTAPNGTMHGSTHATAAERHTWASRLQALLPFPTQTSPRGEVFAEANLRPAQPDNPSPASNAGYPIAHLAAMHPAEVISLASDDRLLEIARNTVQMVNDGDHFAPSGAGFSLAWPPSAKVATRHTAWALLANFTRAVPLISVAGNGWEDDHGGGMSGRYHTGSSCRC
jgi:hypothetical protein